MNPVNWTPDDIKRNQQNGVFITVWRAAKLPSATERAILFTQEGTILLQDNALWVRSMAVRYKFPVTILRWEPVRVFGTHGRDDLFLTPWGARTLQDGLEMRRLANSNAANESSTERLPLDTYSNAEDTFIDRHGKSFRLD